MEVPALGMKLQLNFYACFPAKIQFDWVLNRLVYVEQDINTLHKEMH